MVFSDMQIQTAQDAIKVFSGRTFLIQIKISRPCGDLVIDRKDDQLTAIVERHNGKSKVSFPIYEVIEDEPVEETETKGKGRKKKSSNVKVSVKGAVTRLSTILDTIQADHMLAAGKGQDWYVPESRIDRLRADIRSKLQMERDTLLKELIAPENYNKARSRFETALTEALAAAGQLDEYDELVLKFPTVEEIEEKFNFEIVKWEPLKSLEEVQGAAEKDASLSEQVEVIQRTIQQVQKEAPRILDEAYGKIAKILSIAEDCEPGSPTDNDVRLATDAGDRLQALLELWSSMFKQQNTELATVIQLTTKASELAFNDKNTDRVADKFAELRNQWATLPLTTSEGGKALYNWIHPDKGLEAQIKRITKEIEALKAQGEEDNAAKIERKQDRLDTLKEVARIKLERLAGVRAATSIATSEPVTTESLEPATDEVVEEETIIETPEAVEEAASEPVELVDDSEEKAIAEDTDTDEVVETQVQTQTESTENMAAFDQLRQLPIRTLKKLASGKVAGYSTMKLEELALNLDGKVSIEELQSATSNTSNTTTDVGF